MNKFMKMMVVMFICIFIKFTEAEVGEISRKKCLEYSKYVYVQEDSPILSMRRSSSSTSKVSKCGIVETKLIVGGERVDNELEFPHMATLGYNSSESHSASYEWKCGGSLISPLFVLTAAHCGSDRMSGIPVVVLLGVVDTDAKNGKIIEVNDFIMHPEYKSHEKYNDIALVRLTSAINFSDKIRPACLATRSLSVPKLIAIGFGKTEFENDEGSRYLNKVILSHVERSRCELTYQNYKPLKQGIIESQFCAGESEGKKDTCLGDSGGPLQIILNEPHCMYEVYGITSFGKFCGFAESYGVYTNVTSYLEFIENLVWNS